MDDVRAVEVLRELRKHGDIADWWELDAALDHAIATIERERWIPCSEGLPEPGEHVDVFPCVREDTYNFYAHSDGGTNGVKAGNWYHNDSEGYDLKMSPTHWRRPLPDPQPDGQEG